MAAPADAVSVVVAARNAEQWAPRLVECLRQQTHAEWEAIVVDDGSTDSTAESFRRAADGDARIRVLSRPPSGVSAARNAGIAAASHDWLLFLDADDRLHPEALARLTGLVAQQPDLEFVRCEWAWETSAGRIATAHDPELNDEGADLFLVSARRCPTAPMAAIIRKDVVEEVGRFDTGLVVAEDWDLWQRVARRGLRTGLVKHTLAYYRLTPGSATRRNFVGILTDSRVVIERGHTADPRVHRPRPEYAEGAPRGGRPWALDSLGLWTVAATVGVGAPPDETLAAYPRAGRLRVDDAVTALYRNVPLAAGVLQEQWPELWEQVAERLVDTAVPLADWLGHPGDGDAIVRGVEARVIAHTDVPSGSEIGESQALDVDLSRPLADVQVAPGVTQVVMRVHLGPARLGDTSLRVSDGDAPTADLRRAIAIGVARAVTSSIVRDRATARQIQTALGGANVARAVGCALLDRTSSAARQLLRR